MITKKNRFLLLCAFLFLLSCGQSIDKKQESNTCNESFPQTEKWILIQDTSISKGGPWAQSGYVNQKGDTMIPLDKYMCLSDTFEYYGIVFDYKKQKLVGIDKNEKVLFEAVWNLEGSFIQEFEGRIMVVRNEKYGFANHKGEIIIEPKYNCAEPFFNGKAKVSNECQKSKDEHYRWKSNTWQYIDKCGNTLKSE
jgi:hypothetical protein